MKKEDLKRNFKNYEIALIVLYIWTAIMVVCCFADDSYFAIAFISFIITLTLRRSCNILKKNNERLIRIYELVVEYKNVDINKIALLVDCDYDKVLDDVKYLVNHGFVKGYYINYNTKCLVENHVRALKVYDITCPCCCAFNRMKEKKGKCEYCGSSLVASEKDATILR